MPKPPVTNATPAGDIAKALERIDVLERQVDLLIAAGAASAAKAPLLTFPKHRDVAKVLYKHPDEAPPHGCVLVFDTELEPTRYGGKFRPRGGAVIENIFTDTGTGDLSIEEALADAADWSEFTQWMVTVTATVTGTFAEVDADPISITVPAGTIATNVEIDGDPGVDVEFVDGFEFDMAANIFGVHKPRPTGLIRLIPEGGVTVDHPEAAFHDFGVNGSDNLVGSAAWLYAGGIPYVQASALIDSGDYSGDHTLTVIARAWPVPTLTQPTP